MVSHVESERSELNRLIALEGSVNFRDIGGYETENGQMVRWRRVFRADGLSKLSDGDLDVLADLGIATVIDLRTASELEAGRFPVDRHPVAFHHFPLLDILPDPESFKVAPGMLGAQYLEMANAAATQIGDALRVIADSASHPVVVHCTAGKDRTGVLTAVLLGCLGVREDIIVSDYLLSADAMSRLRTKLIEIYPDGAEMISNADELFSATEDSIRDLLSMFANEHGSILGYALSTGIDQEVIDALRAGLLTDAGN
jgi:protein-tyrosine phosphatase